MITPWKRRWELGGGAGLADDFHFIRGFTSQGWRVHYVSPRDADPPDIARDGYVVHAFPNFFETTARWPVWLRRLIWPTAFTLLAVWRALRVARHERPDIVLGQTHLASLPVFLTGMVCGVPSVIKLFGVETLNERHESRLRHLRRNAEMLAAVQLPHDAWIVLDDGTRGDAALRRHRVPSEKIRLLPNGVELAWSARRGDGDGFRRVHGIGDARVLLWLARLVDWKRPSHALRALAAALTGTPQPLVLVIAGDGPERPRLPRLARELGVADRVCFAGPIAHERVPDAMAAATLFLATGERSNKSIATCEAMLCGVPVAAFDTGGTSDVVRHGETGILVPDGDVDALAAAIVSIVDDDALRDRLGTEARAFAASRFTDWERRVEMEREIIDGLALPRR